MNDNGHFTGPKRLVLRGTAVLCGILLLACGALVSRAQSVDGEAQALMEHVRGAMPEVPLDMEAQIRVLDPNGKPVSKLQAHVVWTPRREGGRNVQYDLLGPDGEPAERMEVSLSDLGSAFSYQAGAPLQTAPLPDLFAPVGGSDINWMELSFSFFFWPGPRIVGEERVAGRWDCKIVEIPCPADLGGGWSHIRLWVVPAYSAVIRGEAWKDGRAIKRFDVDSIRRLRKVYMIGDMTVRDLDRGSRSLLKVGKMKMFAPDLTPEELEELNSPVVW